MAAAKLVVASESFAVEHDGRELFVNAGTRVLASHPLAKAHPERFAPAEPRPDLEAPTRKPASRRKAT